VARNSCAGVKYAFQTNRSHLHSHDAISEADTTVSAMFNLSGEYICWR
jgi:hypothetical protein